MKTQLRILKRRGAFTYMTVVITMILVGLMLAAYLKMVSVQNQLSMRSQITNRTVPILEAGIEEAMAHLNQNGAPDAAGSFNLANLAVDGWSGNSVLGWTKSGRIGNDYYFVQISSWAGSNTAFPFINSTGYVQQSDAFALNRSLGPFVADLMSILNQRNYSRRTVQCTTTNVPVFTKALVAKRGITMSGQNVRTDSFDSITNSPYNDGYGHYTNSPGKWRDNGDIASNDTITNAVCIGNANIYGKVATGPYGTVCVGSSGMVGDIAFQSDPANKGKIQPGWSTDDMNMEFPSITPPSTNWYSANGDSLKGDVNGTTYDVVLDSNNYIIDGNAMSGKIYVSGNVQLLVTKGINMGGSDEIVLAPGARLKIYADCPTASLGGNGVQNPGMANDFYLFGTDKLTSLSYGGNAAFTGVFYAPNADFILNGGGGQQIDFSGSAIARTVKLNGNFSFHYDENLKRVGLYRGFVVTSWNEK